ncbi:MAG: hypothetical protein NTU44_06800 [Bacteroidetes bacterium]|nr:hypothetical protein [Bacteroidota bacterium]
MMNKSLIIILGILSVLPFTAYSQVKGTATDNPCASVSGGSVNGQVLYDNAQLTPLGSTWVYLQSLTRITLDSVMTDEAGNYHFCGLENTTYRFAFKPLTPIGGITNEDVQDIFMDYMGFGTLSPFRQLAGDVNRNQYINSTDAMLALRRVLSQISSFPTGNWVFEDPYVVIQDGSSIILNIKGLCTGDANGSYVPKLCNPILTIADAGPEQPGVDATIAVLAANSPGPDEIGTWSDPSGGGLGQSPFSDVHNPASTFTGMEGQRYNLIWTISNACGYMNSDTVQITFNVLFNCGDDLIDDRNGMTYPTVRIGTQCWMKANLNIGGMINSSQNQANNPNIEKYCYNNDKFNCDQFGGLYSWNEMMGYSTTPGVNGICPANWHIPTNQEFCTMFTYLDPTVSCSTIGWTGTTAGGKIKETGTSHWQYPNTGATNSSGFTALGGGYWSRYTGIGVFYSYYWTEPFWTSTASSSNEAYNYYVYYNNSAVNHKTNQKSDCMAVRCIKD